MKVKKKYILIFIISIFSLLIISVIIFFIILSQLNIRYEDGKRFVASGFSLEPAGIDEIANYTGPFQYQIDIKHYDLRVDLFPENEFIEAMAKITVSLKSNYEGVIELNFNDGFDIHNLEIDSKKYEYDSSNDKIRIVYDPIEKSEVEIFLSYDGTPENLGFGSFNFDNYNDNYIVYTLNEPIFASSWFPCNDIPSDKAMLDLYITNDSSMTSVSNGVLVSTEINSNRKTYHWKTKYPISTYLISIYSADYEYFNDKYITNENDTMLIDYYVFANDLENAKKDFSFHPEAIKVFAKLFGEYPFIKEKYGVAQFLWSFGAMEHQTITGIGNNFVTGNNFFTSMLVHELAHQWWGNAVTLNSWKDIWLNEGFATYSEALYTEKKNGFSALKSKMLSFLTDFKGLKLYNPEKLFSRIVYNKGAWVLHMLRKEVGDKKFFELLKNYYLLYKYGNASTAEFINLAEQMSQKDLTKFFDQWLFSGEGCIEIEYGFRQELSDTDYIVNLKINQIQIEFYEYDFILDLDFYYDNGVKKRDSIRVYKRTSEYQFLFSNKIKKLDLDPDNWLAAKITFVDQSKN